jgi:hypothetical protein
MGWFGMIASLTVGLTIALGFGFRKGGVRARAMIAGIMLRSPASFLDCELSSGISPEPPGSQGTALPR